jgi:dienelactone hydrolase
MANIILFHPSLGFTRDMEDTAECLREKGHTVFAPDMFGGKTFEDETEADMHLKQLTIPAVMMRARDAIANYPTDSVYMGFSIGALAAMIFSAKKPGALACIPVAGAALLTEIGVASWPKSVPVSLHVANGDPGKRADAIESFGNSVRASGAGFEDFEYPCNGHLFTFKRTTSYDPASAKDFWIRIFAFLDGHK